MDSYPHQDPGQDPSQGPPERPDEGQPAEDRPLVRAPAPRRTRRGDQAALLVEPEGGGREPAALADLRHRQKIVLVHIHP